MDNQSVDIEKLKLRDTDSFKKLYECFKGGVYNYLLVKTRGNEDLAGDILNETFCSAIESAPKLKNSENLGGWLFRIAFCRLMDHYRKQGREDRHTKSLSVVEQSLESAEDTLIMKEKAYLLTTAIESLKDEQKTALKLKYIDEKSQKEIAKILNKSESTVEGILYRAKNELRKEIQKLYD